jgi:hypothetical protein
MSHIRQLAILTNRQAVQVDQGAFGEAHLHALGSLGVVGHQKNAPPLEIGGAKAVVVSGVNDNGGVQLRCPFSRQEARMSRVNRLYDKPKIWTTTLAIEGVSGINQADTIEYLEYFWLVGGWIERHAAKLRTPKRLIWLQPLPHQRVDGSPFGDFVLSEPLPIDVWEGKRSGGQYVVVERPDIWFRTPAAH